MKVHSHCPRSKAELERRGYIVARVERWVAQARKRIDMFGFADLVAIKPASELGFVPGEILAVQVCGVDVAAHARKIAALDTVQTWFDAGGKLEIHGWALRGARGKRKTWTARVVRYETWPSDGEQR